MANEVNSDFWNELALGQIAAGGSPSVITEVMKKHIDGDSSATEELKESIDVEKAISDGILFKAMNPSYR